MRKDNFKENLKIINNQIKQIGNLVNEFSDFARMPKPVLKKWFNQNNSWKHKTIIEIWHLQ